MPIGSETALSILLYRPILLFHTNTQHTEERPRRDGHHEQSVIKVRHCRHDKVATTMEEVSDMVAYGGFRGGCLSDSGALVV